MSDQHGCLYSFIIKLASSVLHIKKICVHSICYKYNHILHYPSKLDFHKTIKKMTAHQKNVVEIMIQFDIELGKVVDAYVYEARKMEHVSFSDGQLYKHVQKVGKCYLGEDIETMLAYFKKQKMKCIFLL